MCIKAAFIDVIVSISVRQRCNNTSMVWGLNQLRIELVVHTFEPTALKTEMKENEGVELTGFLMLMKLC